jgi:pimeloyl-ACP methyl ester carboxylesterase
MWQALQADQAGLVANSRHVAAERSGHYIQQDRPDLVIDAVRQVVEAVRNPAR